MPCGLSVHDPVRLWWMWHFALLQGGLRTLGLFRVCVMKHPREAKMADLEVKASYCVSTRAKKSI